MSKTISNMPCRFCEGFDLSDNEWYIDDAEVDAIECNECKAGARKPVWNLPIDYRGFKIAINYHPYEKAPLIWFDPEHDLTPVHSDDPYEQGPGDYVDTVNEARVQIDALIDERVSEANKQQFKVRS